MLSYKEYVGLVFKGLTVLNMALTGCTSMIVVEAAGN